MGPQKGWPRQPPRKWPAPPPPDRFIITSAGFDRSNLQRTHSTYPSEGLTQQIFTKWDDLIYDSRKTGWGGGRAEGLMELGIGGCYPKWHAQNVINMNNFGRHCCPTGEKKASIYIYAEYERDLCQHKFSAVEIISFLDHKYKQTNEAGNFLKISENFFFFWLLQAYLKNYCMLRHQDFNFAFSFAILYVRSALK